MKIKWSPFLVSVYIYVLGKHLRADITVLTTASSLNYLRIKYSLHFTLWSSLTPAELKSGSFEILDEIAGLLFSKPP